MSALSAPQWDDLVSECIILCLYQKAHANINNYPSTSRSYCSIYRLCSVPLAKVMELNAPSEVRLFRIFSQSPKQWCIVGKSMVLFIHAQKSTWLKRGGNKACEHFPELSVEDELLCLCNWHTYYLLGWIISVIQKFQHSVSLFYDLSHETWHSETLCLPAEPLIKHIGS